MYGLRPCTPKTADLGAVTIAGRDIMAEAQCWADWHTGRTAIRRHVERAVLAIEAEAVAAERARLVAAVEALAFEPFKHYEEDMDGQGLQKHKYAALDRAAVLALLEDRQR
jgi:hypothetical protein